MLWYKNGQKLIYLQKLFVLDVAVVDVVADGVAILQQRRLPQLVVVKFVELVGRELQLHQQLQQTAEWSYVGMSLPEIKQIFYCDIGALNRLGI